MATMLAQLWKSQALELAEKLKILDFWMTTNVLEIARSLISHFNAMFFSIISENCVFPQAL
ncbi:MAG TPA: hypothetical protein VKZ53_26400 [Candidatus Angelobacter sp.]|nr:hypothetical protein [Candidatus Angelobacter sp.]